jgi:hypothetical protein
MSSFITEKNLPHRKGPRLFANWLQVKDLEKLAPTLTLLVRSSGRVGTPYGGTAHSGPYGLHEAHPLCAKLGQVGHPGYRNSGGTAHPGPNPDLTPSYRNRVGGAIPPELR